MHTIMVVDDERDVLELLRFVLERDGFTVIPAHNGEEALQRLGLLPSGEPPVRPDVVVLDVMMPGLDGCAVRARMAENEATRPIPVIILSAKGHLQDLFALTGNVAALLEKPFDPRVLRNKIKDILEKS